MRTIAIWILGIATLQMLPGCGNQTTNSGSESAQGASQTEADKLNDFGKKYAAAWSSQKPENIASFYADSGSLMVNNGSASVGRSAITKVAEGFMTAFPDMVVTMDSMVTTPSGVKFHWTLMGTNTGPNGTGKKVRISGFELLQINKDGLINESKGNYDSKEYDRQIKDGVTN